jgi:hypothetical protein
MVTQDTVRDFMSSMSLSDINGVGHQLSHDLQEKGYVMCMDLWSVPKCLLQVHTAAIASEKHIFF